MPIPVDSFTPHGYLDNPSHARNLNPLGVIRSTSGIGFAWHYPALARGYGYREFYNASLNIALTLDDKTYFRHADFTGLYADLHTKNVFRYRWNAAGVDVSVMFWLVGEHALACRTTLTSDVAQSVQLTAFVRYERHIGASGVWGESGLVGLKHDGALIVQGFEDGEAFALKADQPAVASGASAELTTGFLQMPVMKQDHVVVTGHKGESVQLYGASSYALNLDANQAATLDVVLARAIRRDLAVQQNQHAMTARFSALAKARQQDESFWAQAPTLAGDWPEHWRRGVITDFETLRMMVKAPLGIYKHPWDAMQIHAPRVVLAEAAIDALLLGYANPDLAKAMLLGTFLDAPADNIPCSREDGSYNMVGANGSECGTAPEWGYPVEVTAFLYDLNPDPVWLASIYPKLKAFLDWWLKHRSDDEGYLVYDNSWESGQDLSDRFGPQKEGGGSTIRMVRPVDLQAAMARACNTMMRFAKDLQKPQDVTLWQERFTTFNTFTKTLWHQNAYRDYDARVGWSDVWDVMQLAPVALELAGEVEIEALRPRIQRLAEDTYLWPMFVWTATDAALHAGEFAVAAEVAASTVDRAYGYWDSRDYSESGRLPGVTCEYWGIDGTCGAEGYGWGAFGIHLLMHVIMGFKPQGASFSLTPNLPKALLKEGACYTIRNLQAGTTRMDVTYHVIKNGIDLRLSATNPVAQENNPASTSIQISTTNGATHHFRLPDAPYKPDLL